MYTADMARQAANQEFDERLKNTVEDAIRSGRTNAYMRVYIDDWFKDDVKQMLEDRGFNCDHGFTGVLTTDIYIWW